MLDEPSPALAPIPGTTESSIGSVESHRPAADPAPNSWGDFILAVLKGTERGFTIADLMERAKELGLGSFAERFGRSPNGFFAAARVLELEGSIYRKGRLRYLPDVYKRIQAGELADVANQHDEAPGGDKGVVYALLASEGPMTAREVIRRLAASPETAELGTKRLNTVYAILSKLAQGATVIRGDDGRYRLASQPAPVAENVTRFPNANGGQR